MQADHLRQLASGSDDGGFSESVIQRFSLFATFRRHAIPDVASARIIAMCRLSSDFRPCRRCHGSNGRLGTCPRRQD